MRHERGTRVHVAFVLTTAVLCAAHLRADALTASLLLFAATLTPAVAAAVLVVRRRPPDPSPWVWVLVGVALLTANHVDHLIQVSIGGAARQTPLVPALLLPLGYLCLLLGSALLMRPVARSDGGQLADAAIMAVAGAGVLWTVVVDPALGGRDAALWERADALLTLLLLSGVAGAVVRSLASASAGRATLAYLLVAIAATVVGNLGKWLTTQVSGDMDPWVGSVWIAGYLALAAAATHPSSHEVTSPGRPVARRLTTGHLAFLGLALSFYPLLAGTRALVGDDADLLQLCLGSLLLVPLVLYRVSRLARLHLETEQELVHQATHDALTGLPNRRAVDDQVEDALRRVRDGGAAGAVVCFLDLDDFKTVNDEHGHHVGDELLVVVAQRLRRALPAGGVVARFGGDEFVLVLTGEPEQLLDDTTARVSAALADPVDLGGLLVTTGASLGAAVVRLGDTRTAEQVMTAADTAMYTQKHRGRRRAGAARADAAPVVST